MSYYQGAFQGYPDGGGVGPTRFWADYGMPRPLIVAPALPPGLDGYEPASPEWWRDRLIGRIGLRWQRVALAESYYQGYHRLAYATDKYQSAFGDMFRAFSDNWMRIVVDSCAERLQVQGFRLDSGATGDQLEIGDKAAWGVWQRNRLDSEQILAHTTAIVTGQSYILVGFDDDGSSLIQVEHPAHAIVEMEPSTRRRRLAGLRTFQDVDGSVVVTLYLPDEIYWWRYQDRAFTLIETWGNNQPATGKNPLGVVPLIPLVNSPTTAQREGESDVLPVVPLQDAVNKLVLDMMVSSEFAAFPQRWATGLEIPEDESGNRQVPFQVALDKILTSADPQTKFGDFNAVNMANYTGPIKELVSHIAAQTSTPPHYLMNEGIKNVSADAIKSAEASLVAKVKRKMPIFAEAWEEAISLASFIDGIIPTPEAWSSEVIWVDPESRTKTQEIDSIMKLGALGLPHIALWNMIPGVSPSEVERWRTLRELELATDPGFFGAQLTPQDPAVASSIPLAGKGGNLYDG